MKINLYIRCYRKDLDPYPIKKSNSGSGRPKINGNFVMDTYKKISRLLIFVSWMSNAYKHLKSIFAKFFCI